MTYKNVTYDCASVEDFRTHPGVQARNGQPITILTKFAVAAAITTFSIYICWKHTQDSPSLLGWNSWAMSEWLINYEGGFVRRGLAGHVILFFSNGEPAITVINNIVFTCFASLCILMLGLVLLSSAVTPMMAALMLLVPGGVYGMVMGNEFYYRKEISFHIYLATAAILFILSRRIENIYISRAFQLLTVVVILVGSAVLPFVHEGFIFISAVPTTVLIYFIAASWSARKKRNVAFAYLALAAMEFLVLAYFKGDASTARAIWASIHPVDQKLISQTGAIAGGIEAIGSTLSQQLSTSRSVLTSGYGWYWGFALAASGLYLVTTVLVYWRDGREVHRGAAWVFTLYGVCLIDALPLFIVGWDWGRWIAGVNLSVVILMCAGELHCKLPIPTVEVLKGKGSYTRAWSSAILAAALLFGLTFKLPEACLVGTGEPFSHVWRLLIGVRATDAAPSTSSHPV